MFCPSTPMAAVITDTIDFYQIYYSMGHKDLLFPFSKPYFNEGLTIFFENEVIKRLVMVSHAEKIAVCSWKLREKMRMNIPPRVELTYEHLQRDFQVLSFTKNTKHHKVLARADVWHPGFTPAIKLIWEKLGYRLPIEAQYPIYQNHFCARADIYKDYVINFLSPAMELIESDGEVRALCTADSHYDKLTGVDLKSVKEKLGIAYYPMAPFILERCPSLWFTMKKIKVDYL